MKIPVCVNRQKGTNKFVLNYSFTPNVLHQRTTPNCHRHLLEAQFTNEIQPNWFDH